MNSHFERDPVKRLEKYLARKNLPRNWIQYVYGFEDLNNSKRKSNAMKNKLIKNTKIRLLRNYLASTQNLPNNWETKFTNVNKNTRNKLVKEFAKKPNTPKRNSVPSLRHMILEQHIHPNNIKRNKYGAYIDINAKPQKRTLFQRLFRRVPGASGGRRILLNNSNTNVVNSGAKNLLNKMNAPKKVALRAIELQVGRIPGMPIKNKINVMAMVGKVYHPTDMKYKRIVSDLFYDTYKLINTRNRLPTSFISKYLLAHEPNSINFQKFMYPVANRAPTIPPITTYMYTIGNDQIENYPEYLKLVRDYKSRFMSTKILHVGKEKREKIWRTIRDWKGSVGTCVKKCNEIYYTRISK